MIDLVDTLAAVVRGDRRAAAELATLDAESVRRTADEQGVLPLVANRLAPAGDQRRLRSVLWEEYQPQAVREALRERDLQECLEQLRLEHVPVLLLKGAELAYTHYERPDFRPRVDTDLMIPADARDRVKTILERCGFESAGEFPGDLVMYQTSFTKRRGAGILHVMDVHWRIANPQVFGTVLSFEELLAEAVPVPGLGPGARGPSPVHALVLACVHRVAHHFNRDLLIWLYDIHLMASRLSANEWAELATLARTRGVAAVCIEGLQRASHYFETPIPNAVREELVGGSASASDRTTAAYLEPRRHIQNVMADFWALPRWGSRARLVREHLFPSPEYMRGIYAPASSAPLAVLYVRRAVRGARKWLGRN